MKEQPSVSTDFSIDLRNLGRVTPPDLAVKLPRAIDNRKIMPIPTLPTQTVKVTDDDLSELDDQTGRDGQDVSDDLDSDRYDVVSEETVTEAVAVVQVYHSKCLRCTHLLPQLGKKEFNSCHSSRGNEHCPAATMQIVQHIPMDKIFKAYDDAVARSDVSKLSRIYAMIAKKPEVVQKKVIAELHRRHPQS